MLTLKECKELYRLSRGALLNDERQGLITPARTPGGVRRYRVEDLERLLGLSGESHLQLKTILPVCRAERGAGRYAGVSTRQPEAYLKNQSERLEALARGRRWDDKGIQEMASGVNENRRGLQKLLNMVKRGEGERGGGESPDR